MNCTLIVYPTHENCICLSWSFGVFNLRYYIVRSGSVHHSGCSVNRVHHLTALIAFNYLNICFWISQIFSWSLSLVSSAESLDCLFIRSAVSWGRTLGKVDWTFIWQLFSTLETLLVKAMGRSFHSAKDAINPHVGLVKKKATHSVLTHFYYYLILLLLLVQVNPYCYCYLL